MAIIVKTQTLVLIIYLNKMAQKTYRQQTSGTLGTLTNCPSCSPSTTTYTVSTCSNSYLHYVDEISGFSYQQAVLLQPYSVGDVVWIKTGASATIECATITSVNNPDPATHYIDENQGPWSQCSQCYAP
jgi:hypothetical protein